MRGDDRWRIRKEEDRLYRVRPARLGCDRRCFCYGIRRRLRLVLVEPLIVNLPNFYFIFLRKEHYSLRDGSLVLTKSSLTCRRQSHPSCVSISFLEVWIQMNAVRSILKLARLQKTRPLNIQVKTLLLQSCSNAAHAVL